MILAVLEQSDGSLKKISAELAAAARKAQALLGADGVALLLVGADPTTVDAATALDCDLCLTVQGEAFATYAAEAWAVAVVQAAKEVSAPLVLLGSTSFGRDLAPRVAGIMQAGLLADLGDLTVEDGRLIAERSVYSGKVIAKVASLSDVTVATVRPNAFSPAGAEASPCQRRELEVAVDPASVHCRVREVRRQAATRPELTEASVVVAGGRGLKDPENFHLVEELADLLGAAVGTTRATVDAGWRPHSEQIGQTGKNIAPALYINVGISGAVQHISGVLGSRTIVSINRDAEAPIFKISDYGLVGDALEILPHLIDEVRRLG